MKESNFEYYINKLTRFKIPSCVINSQENLQIIYKNLVILYKNVLKSNLTHTSLLQSPFLAKLYYINIRLF